MGRFRNAKKSGRFRKSDAGSIEAGRKRKKESLSCAWQATCYAQVVLVACQWVDGYKLPL